MKKQKSSQLHICVGKTGEKLLSFSKNVLLLAVLSTPMMLRAQQLNWSGGSSQEIEGWFNTILMVLMGIFVMTSVIMGSLAFKQLATDGNWKDFWSKIAGSIGMFVVPIVIYWVRDVDGGTVGGG